MNKYKQTQNVTSISVVGLGKLGLCMAACFADKGFRVTGMDIDVNKIDLINKGENPIHETGLTQLINKCKNKLKATSDYNEAILNSQVTFIVVPTPSKADGSFSNEYLEDALREIGLVLKEKYNYHLVVITSTVMPGTTENVGKLILEEASGKKCGEDFGIAYNPEFIALGSVIQDFLTPDFILIGEMSTKDGYLLETIYKSVCNNNPPIAKMNPVNAEIAKMSLNCYVTMKITFANSLATVCEKVEGADADIITEAIGLDSRIGKKYLKPGLGFGGPCFPRDNVAFAAFARNFFVPAKLAETVDEVNREQATRVIEMIEEAIINKQERVKIGVLGLSYKPHSPVIESSQAMDIVENQINKGRNVIVYDPQALGEVRCVLGDKVEYACSALECIEKSDIVVIATPWTEFKKIDFSQVKKPPSLIIDCWRIAKEKRLKIKWLGVGKGADLENRN